MRDDGDETGADGARLADLITNKADLSLKLGSAILTLGRTGHGRRKLLLRPLTECADRLIVLDNGGPYKRKPVWREPPLPQETASPDTELPDVTPPEARIGVFFGAQISAGVITTADGRTIEETLAGVDAAPFGPFVRDERGFLHQVRPRFAVRRRLRGAPAVLLRQPLDGAYGRWIVETLPRLALVEDRFDLSRLVFIVASRDDLTRAIIEDSLALFGIRSDQIVELGDETVVVDELIYPAPLVEARACFAARCADDLERIAMRVRANPFALQRLFVADRGQGAPLLRNEAAIVAIAKRHDFTVVEPHLLSLYQRVGLFRRARIVAGVHGAALANAMFSTENLTLFALMAVPPPDDPFAGLMDVKAGRYMALCGSTTGEPSGGQGPDDGVTVDPARFEAMLRAVVDPASR